MMNTRGRLGPGQVCCPLAFRQQPPRALIVDTSPPGWLDVSANLCQALDNLLTLACSLEGPCRLPLLSLYAVASQQECLLPFVQVKGNLARLRSCVEELRSMPREGCLRPLGNLFNRAVRDSILQFKQYSRHVNADSQIDSSSIEVTVLTSRPGGAVVKQLEAGLKDTDLASLRRLLVIHIILDRATQGDDPDFSPEMSSSPGLDDPEDSLMLGTELDLQQVENGTIALESVFKAWLHDLGGEREHLHLLLPPLLQTSALEKLSPVCVKCDAQERLLSPALFPGAVPELGAQTEAVRNFQLPGRGPSGSGPLPHRLTVVKALRSDGVCESLLYGLPLILRATNSWKLDWDEMEANHHYFNALCHTLRSRSWFLLARSEPAPGSAVFCHYVLQPSASLSLLLKPVAGRELLLPCHMPAPGEDPPEQSALATIQSSLGNLEEDPAFNPLCLKTNLYQHLRGLLSRTPYPSGVQRRDQNRPPGGRAPRQQQERQLQGRARATVAPLPSGPKPARRALTMTRSHAPLCSDSDDLMV